MDRAVVQIGQKRIGEVALATSALTSLTASLVPWMNVSLTWRRSVAAGLTVEMLMEHGRHQERREGLFLSAIMHPLGRVVLGTLFPKQYDAMIPKCDHSGTELLEEERQVFPLDHVEVMASLLASWGLPNEICLPLKHAFAGAKSVNNLPEPTRTKAELLSLAIYMGILAVRNWEAWDAVEPPPVLRLNKYGIDSVSAAVSRIRDDLFTLEAGRTDVTKCNGWTPSLGPMRELTYCDLTGGDFDFMGEVISSLGVKIVRLSKDDLRNCDHHIVVNCLGVAPQRLVAKASRSFPQHLTIITEPDKAEKYSEYGQVVALPTSYGRFRAACWSACRTVLQSECSGSQLSVIA